MKRLLVVLAALSLALLASACNPKDKDEDVTGGNPIDRALAPRFAAEGIIPVEASNFELCRRLSADLLGRYLTADEVASDCDGRRTSDIVRDFQSRPEYLRVSQRNWRDRLKTSDVLVDWRYLKDLYDNVDRLHRGDMRYRDFGLETMSDPGFIMNVFQPEEKVERVFDAFMGRTATEAEQSDLAGLYRPWIPLQEPDPDFTYSMRNAARVFPLLCEPIATCTSSFFGGGVLDLSDFDDPMFQGIKYDDLTEGQKSSLREPGRILTAQALFYEAAADEMLSRYLGWSDGGRFPTEPGIILPEAREALADYLRETENYPAAERMVLTSWLYRMKAEVPDDGLGDDPTAPVQKFYAAGPVKSGVAEVWLDSAAGVSVDFGACDHRYADGFSYFILMDAIETGLVSQAQGDADMRRLWEMQESQIPWDDEQKMPDFTYQFVARLIGGCPGYLSMRQPQTGLSYAFTQESISELMCDPAFLSSYGAPAPNFGTGTTAETILDHQMRITYGRNPTEQERADFSTAAASCSGADCTPEGMRNAVCVGLLGGAEMIFY